MLRRMMLICMVLGLLLASGLALAGTPINPQQADPTPTPGVGVAPLQPTAAPTPPVVDPITAQVTPGDMPVFNPPPTLDELIADYPELGPYIEQVQGQLLDEMDLGELYTRIIQIYDAEGATGVAIFLEESGILAKLGLPHSYLDLLIVYDSGGFEAVKELARARGIINDRDELLAYMALDSKANLSELTTALEELAVTVYGYLDETDEVQIGIPLAVLEQFQRPDDLLDYLVEIANLPHVVGMRVPVPMQTSGLTAQAVDSESAERIGADAWHAAGFTGSGIRIGVLDLGFGGILDRIAEGELPENIVANEKGDVLNNQFEDHGTACAMIVHRIAPEAELYIAYYDGTGSGMQEAMEWLASKDVQIISHSAGSNLGPRDGTWGQSAWVTDFIREHGVLWVNAAGNEALSHSLWRFDPGDRGQHLFGQDDVYLLEFTVFTPEAAVLVNWNGSWTGREENNYHITIYDARGDEIAVGAESRRGRRNDFPYQGVFFYAEPGETYFMSIRKVAGDDANQFLDIFIMGGEFPNWAQVPEYSLASPADVDAAVSVGATGLRNDALEDYSSQGPTGDERIKPDVTAPTGERVPGYRRGFSGTSGATPVVAGAAALVMQRYPDMPLEEVKAFLMSSVLDLGDDGLDSAFGAGRLALPAVDAALPGPDTSSSAAAVSAVDVRFGVRLGSETGMKATLSFLIENLRDRQVAAVLQVTNADGSPLASPDPAYEVAGTVGVSVVYTVAYDRSAFRDVVLFLPESVFSGLAPGTELSYTVGLLDVTDAASPQVLWRSEPENITVVER